MIFIPIAQIPERCKRIENPCRRMGHPNEKGTLALPGTKCWPHFRPSIVQRTVVGQRCGHHRIGGSVPAGRSHQYRLLAAAKLRVDQSQLLCQRMGQRQFRKCRQIQCDHEKGWVAHCAVQSMSIGTATDPIDRKVPIGSVIFVCRWRGGCWHVSGILFFFFW